MKDALPRRFAGSPVETADAEALRLLEAFFAIADPQSQAEVLALAERYAGESSRFAELLQHFAARH